MTQIDGTAPEAAASATDSAYAQTGRSTPSRYRERATYDRAAVHAVLDEALVAHVGFIRDGAPVVLPTLHARIGDTIYIHGSTGGRFALLDGEPVSVTVTLLDALVLARSWFHHSAGYRSVVVHGAARVVTDDRERWDAMAGLVDHVVPGRSADSRPPLRKELSATTIVAVDLAEVSLKSRGGHVADDEADLGLPHWAGTIPLRLVPGSPVPTEDLAEGIALPGYVARYAR
ncbi:MAG TPA: pyridoxamine 5'-phosphate oxidase family protein [Actinocrinis sp.]|nr:pyridoxamine 5'-phosphate oxidase family protein [Actinocrinis sp.]